MTGRTPVRTELTVAQNPEPADLTVKVCNGRAVTRVDDKGRELENPVRARDGLKPGNLLVAPTLVGEVRAVVAMDGVGDLCWVSGGLVGDLEYDAECGYWITTLAINKKLLT
jgi:hypothetical protein